VVWVVAMERFRQYEQVESIDPREALTVR
jgi:hypothetical protein